MPQLGASGACLALLLGTALLSQHVSSAKPPAPSAGCRNTAPPPPHGELLRRTLSVSDGNFTATPRHYALHVPAEYDHADPPSALLLYFHMQDESADDAALTEYEALGDQHGFFVVYPEGHDAGGGELLLCKQGRTV